MQPERPAELFLCKLEAISGAVQSNMRSAAAHSVMSSTATAKLGPLEIAGRIIELDADVRRLLDARRYEAAAAVFDHRKALERRLNQVGSATLIRNVKTALRGHYGASAGPTIDLLEADPTTHASAAHPSLTAIPASAPLPVRWILRGDQTPCRAAIQQRLRVESLESDYYAARFPALTPSTLARATRPAEWFGAAVSEAARLEVHVVWLVAGLRALVGRGICEALEEHLRDTSTEFVAWVAADEADLASRLSGLPAVSTRT